MKTGKLLTMVGALLATAVLMAACKDEEQGRVLLYKKGVYMGAKVKPLTAEQVSNIQARTAMQGAGSTALSGNVSTSQPNVRPPGPAVAAKPAGAGK